MYSGLMKSHLKNEFCRNVGLDLSSDKVHQSNGLGELA